MLAHPKSGPMTARHTVALHFKGWKEGGGMEAQYNTHNVATCAASNHFHFYLSAGLELGERNTGHQRSYLFSYPYLDTGAASASKGAVLGGQCRLYSVRRRSEPHTTWFGYMQGTARQTSTQDPSLTQSLCHSSMSRVRSCCA